MRRQDIQPYGRRDPQHVSRRAGHGRRPRFTAPFAVAVAVLLIAASPALAAKGVVSYFGTTNGPGTADGEFNTPRGVAVNATGAGGVGAGDVYVVDALNHRVQRFNSVGVYQGKFGTSGSGAGQFSTPTGVAIDQADGSVYVYDQGNRRVSKWSATGAFLFAFGAGVADDPGLGAQTDALQTCVSACFAGLNSSVDGGFGTTTAAPSLAVAPTGAPNAGDLFVADPGPTANRRVQRFSAPGVSGPATMVAKVGGSGSGDGQFGSNSPTRIAVDDAGRVYAVDTGNRRVQRFDATLAFDTVFADGELSGSPAPSDIAIDPGVISAGDASDDRVFVTKPCNSTICPADSYPSPFATTERRIKELSTAGALLDTHLIGSGIVNANGLAVNPGSDRLYLTTSASTGGHGAFVIDDVELQQVELDPVTPISAIGSRAATLHFTVNPHGGPDVSYRVEYSLDGTTWKAVRLGETVLGSQETEQEIDEVVEPYVGFEPNTSYSLRVVTTRPFNRTVVSGTASFTTGTEKPMAETVGALIRSTRSAQLEARINPRHLATTYRFEYGTTPSYGQSTAPVEIAGNGQMRIVRQAIAGLAPDTTYHYRVVADNAAVGSPSLGGDMTVRTRKSDDVGSDPDFPTRGIELVTQPDKSGQGPIPEGSYEFGNLNPSAGRLLWHSVSGVPGASTGAAGAFEAVRDLSTPQGWSSRSMVPPPSQLKYRGYGQYLLLAQSADRSSALFALQVSNFIPAPEILLRVDADGTQHELHTFPIGQGVTQSSVPTPSNPQVSPDLSHVVASTDQAIDPADSNNRRDFYDVGTPGAPKPVSVLPNGSMAPCGTRNPGESRNPLISVAPGAPARVFFEAKLDPACGLTPPDVVFMRDLNSQTTVRVSPVPIDGVDRGTRVVRVSPDGAAAILLTSNVLTAEDRNQTNDIYRWDLGKGVTCLTCEAPEIDVNGYASLVNPETDVMVSRDLSHVYFNGRGRAVVGEGVQGAGVTPPHNIYVWHDGVIEYVAPMFAGSPGHENVQFAVTQNDYQVSSDGTVFVFPSSAPDVTPDSPSNGTQQAYRYSSRDRSLVCMTCAPPGVENKIAEKPASLLQNQRWNVLSADGGTFVFQTEARLVAGDINGAADVYEWHDGRVRLVSDGETVWDKGNFEANLIGISPDAQDVYFMTGAHLTGFERDNAWSVYSAHRGGGQFKPPVPPVPCVEDACQGPLEATPDFPATASADLVGPGNEVGVQRKRRGSKQCPKRRKSSKKKARGSSAAASKRKPAGKRRCAKTKRKSKSHRRGR